MNSDDLKLFAHIAKAGSISRTAMEIGVDQSTISRRLGLLESELGVRLLHRSGRGVTVTDRGQLLLEYAHAMAHLLDDVQQAMHLSSEQGPTQLHIAAQPTIAKMLFGPLGRELRQRYPHTRLRFVEDLASRILTQLDDGDLDIAILYVPERSGALRFDPLLSEGLHLIAPADFSLPGRELPLSELAHLPLILPSTQHGLRVLFESLAARHGFALNLALECDSSLALTKRLVRENCGCTVLPLAAVAEDLAAGTLKSYQLRAPEIRRNVGLVLGNNRVSANRLWETAQLVRNQVRALVESGAWPDARLDAAMQGARPLAGIETATPMPAGA